jgi:hypothetical protein
MKVKPARLFVGAFSTGAGLLLLLMLMLVLPCSSIVFVAVCPSGVCVSLSVCVCVTPLRLSPTPLPALAMNSAFIYILLPSSLRPTSVCSRHRPHRQIHNNLFLGGFISPLHPSTNSFHLWKARLFDDQPSSNEPAPTPSILNFLYASYLSFFGGSH